MESQKWTLLFIESRILKSQHCKVNLVLVKIKRVSHDETMVEPDDNIISLLITLCNSLYDVARRLNITYFLGSIGEELD